MVKLFQTTVGPHTSTSVLHILCQLHMVEVVEAVLHNVEVCPDQYPSLLAASLSRQDISSKAIEPPSLMENLGKNISMFHFQGSC